MCCVLHGSRCLTVIFLPLSHSFRIKAGLCGSLESLELHKEKGWVDLVDHQNFTRIIATHSELVQVRRFSSAHVLLQSSLQAVAEQRQGNEALFAALDQRLGDRWAPTPMIHEFRSWCSTHYRRQNNKAHILDFELHLTSLHLYSKSHYVNTLLALAMVNEYIYIYTETFDFSHRNIARNLYVL